MTHPVSTWTVQPLETAHNGYTDWQTYAIRDAVTNVCLATVGNIDHYDSEHNLERAQLIAAAPDILEAFKEVVYRLEYYEPDQFDDEGHRQRWHNKMQDYLELIAKAEGRPS